MKEKILTVSEFTKIINKTVSCIDSVWIEGEVTNFKNWQDRWIFFSLKDESAVLDCNLSKYKLRSFGFDLEDGMKIRIMGVAELRKNGRFTVNVEKIQLHGEGALKKAYELLKKKLESEGLFVRKRPIPNYVQKIGLITSRSGVVIQDFQKNLKPLGFKIYFYDSRVEGQEAVSNLVTAVKWFNKNIPNLDVLVIIRGGGSLEDLQAFNNELLGRAIFASEIPVICGIGHDVNVPIASLVADVSVSTPTATAIILNKSWELLLNRLPYIEQELFDSFKDCLDQSQDKIRAIVKDLLETFEERLKDNILKIKLSAKEITYNFNLIFNRYNNFKKELKQIQNNLLRIFAETLKNKKLEISLLIKEIISNFNFVFNKFNNLRVEIENNFYNLNQKIIKIEEKISILEEKILSYLGLAIRGKRLLVKNIEEYLSTVDPKRNLGLGYSIVFDQNKKVIRDVSGINLGEIIQTELYKGEILSKVKKIKPN